ncbi:ArpU family phage transcriptional regulator [Neobacillus sp. B4I6]|uniref:ArpU family phage packaging/lysis transcriptional regulator n=1 Tax=Neobacillus sp. B4I6 TaxID=3373925 RepID=UPI003D191DA5
MQLTLLDVKLTKEVKRQAEKLMSRYKMYEAIIESKKMDLEPKLVASYQGSESQRGNQFYSEPEKIALTEIELDEYTRTLRKLDLVYNSLRPMQQRIWDRRYLLDQQDIDVYSDLVIPDRTYYRLKREMIAVVAEAFGIMAD